MKDADKQLPRFLLMENVPALLSKRHRPNFKIWISDLEKLGYESAYYELNASDFGLPQNRPRLLMLSVFCGTDEALHQKMREYFCTIDSNYIIDSYKKSDFYKPKTIEDLLRLDYSDKKQLAEAIECTPNDTVSRRKIWEENPQLVLKGNRINPDYKVIRTITTKQDRNPNSGNIYFDSGIEGRGKFRYLTPRECLLFMGFRDKDFKHIKKANAQYHKGDYLFSRDKIIRMAGNSIPVKLLEGMFWLLIETDRYMKENNGCT